MSKSTKRVVITVVVVAAVAAAVLLGFYWAGNRSDGGGSKASSEAEKLLKKDLENDYPGTPREVLKFFGRITKCMYNEDLEEEQVELLLEQARKLYDEELLANNPWEQHLQALSGDLEDYRDNDRVIMSCTVQKSSQIKQEKLDGKNMAIAYAQFMTQDKKGSYKSVEKFLLREDESGKWKIVGWELADPDSVDISED